MITLPSPAKVNLFLKIVRRRDDGYHELASLFQADSLFDTLTFDLCERGDKLVCSDPKIPVDERNLVIKALKLFRQRTKRNFHVSISLEKNIPSEAGLGGGSSNAATTLWALNEVFDRPVSLEALKEWGAELGSDVPFFLSTGTAFCQGRGEVMQELIPLDTPQKLVLAKPSFGMSTADVYRNLDVTKLSNRDPHGSLQQFLDGNPEYYNDLEEPAFRISPNLVAFKEAICADHVLMSGSGAAFFCVGNQVSLPGNIWHQEVQPVNREKGAWYPQN